MSSLSPELSLEYLQNIFENLIEIQQAYIYKLYEWAILPIFESQLNPTIQSQITKNLQNKKNIRLQDNYLEIKIWPYTFFFEIKKKKNDYIIVNTIMHSINTIKYLGESLENLKNQELNSFLD